MYKDKILELKRNEKRFQEKYTDLMQELSFLKRKRRKSFDDVTFICEKTYRRGTNHNAFVLPPSTYHTNNQIETGYHGTRNNQAVQHTPPSMRFSNDFHSIRDLVASRNQISNFFSSNINSNYVFNGYSAPSSGLRNMSRGDVMTSSVSDLSPKKVHLSYSLQERNGLDTTCSRRCSLRTENQGYLNAVLNSWPSYSTLPIPEKSRMGSEVEKRESQLRGNASKMMSQDDTRLRSEECTQGIVEFLEEQSPILQDSGDTLEDSNRFFEDNSDVPTTVEDIISPKIKSEGNVDSVHSTTSPTLDDNCTSNLESLVEFEASSPKISLSTYIKEEFSGHASSEDVSKDKEKMNEEEEVACTRGIIEFLEEHNPLYMDSPFMSDEESGEANNGNIKQESIEKEV